MQDEGGPKSIEAHSEFGSGLDYPGAGPQHAFLRDTGRASYMSRSPTATRSLRFARLHAS